MNKENLIKVLVVLTGLTAGLVANPQGSGPMMDGHHKRFEMLDSNKDGKISKDEWQNHFKEIDANNDGFLTEAEMDHHHKTLMEQRHEEMHKQMHEKMKK